MENLRDLISVSLAGWSEVIQSIVDQDQLFMLGLILALSWGLQLPLHRLFDTSQSRLVTIRWTKNLLFVVRRIALPLTILTVGQLGIEIFRAAELNVFLLILVMRAVNLWFAYRLVGALIEINLPAERARFWTHKVLFPLAVFVGLLHVSGLLEAVLAWGVSLGQQRLRITIGSLFFGMLTAIIFYIFSRGVRQFLKEVFLPQAGAEPALTQAISTLISYTVMVIGAGVALGAMGVDLTTFAVIAGGLSVGLGFGLQEIINNFVSGFILLFERSLGPGDAVRIDEQVGVVETVGIRSTTIKTRDEIELIVPNSYFLTEIVTNLTRTRRQVRVRISVGVTYSSSPREVEQALLEAAAQHPGVFKEPHARVQFMDFGDSSLNFDLMVWTDQAHRLPGFSSEIRYLIWDALAAHNIEIPFPQRDLHLRSGVPWTEMAELLRNNR